MKNHNFFTGENEISVLSYHNNYHRASVKWENNVLSKAFRTAKHEINSFENSFITKNMV